MHCIGRSRTGREEEDKDRGMVGYIVFRRPLFWLINSDIHEYYNLCQERLNEIYVPNSICVRQKNGINQHRVVIYSTSAPNYRGLYMLHFKSRLYDRTIKKMLLLKGVLLCKLLGSCS